MAGRRMLGRLRSGSIATRPQKPTSRKRLSEILGSVGAIAYPRTEPTSQNSVKAKFAFWAFSEVRSYKLPRSEGALAYRGGAVRYYGANCHRAGRIRGDRHRLTGGRVK